MWNIRYFLKNISSIFREKGFLNIQRISICLRQIHIFLSARETGKYFKYIENQKFTKVDNLYLIPIAVQCFFFFKCNTLKADNNNIKNSPLKKKLHKSGLFNAANLNGTFRLPYWQWTWFSAARLIWRVNHATGTVQNQIQTDTMIQLRAIFRNASRHAEHCLSVKSRPTVSLIVNIVFTHWEIVHIQQFKFSLQNNLMILNLCDFLMALN